MRFGEICLTLAVFVLFFMTAVGEVVGENAVPTGTEKKIAPSVIPLDAQVERIDIGSNEMTASDRAACHGEWQGPAVFAFPGWLIGDETYASYQDPTETGCTDTYPFEVTSVGWTVYAQSSSTVSFQVQPKVFNYDGLGQPANEICAGPIYMVNLPGTGGYRLTLPLPDPCCVNGPYCAAVYVLPTINGGSLDLVLDDGVAVPPRSDANFNDWGTGWVDLVDDQGWTWNLSLWSNGENSIGNSCGSSVICGDMDNSLTLDISDLVYLVNYLFIGGSPPFPMYCAGDFDNDDHVNIVDLTDYVEYLFAGGDPPSPNCCIPPW
jgi:hypothetical protein